MKSIRTGSIVVAIVCAVCAFFLLTGAAYAADEIVLRFAWTTADSRDDPYGNSAYIFKDLIEERTKGRVAIKLFPNAMLGGERDAIEGLTLGTIDLSINTNANVGTFVQDFQVFDLPFLFSTAEAAYSVLDGPIGQGMMKKLSDIGIKGLGFSEGGFRMTLNNIRPINTPDDFSGIKIRVMENPIYIEMFKALGANPTPMAWPEVVTAVQQRTIDGLEIPISVTHQNKFYEVCKYFSMTRHTYSPLVYLMSLKKFNSLPEDIQKVIVECAEEARQMQRKMASAKSEEMLADLQSRGMIINDVADTAAFQEKIQSLYSTYAKTLGEDLVNGVLNSGKEAK